MAAAVAAAAASRAFKKMCTGAVGFQARGMASGASNGSDVWAKASQLSQELGSIFKKDMSEANWAEARRKWEMMSKLMLEPPEALSLQDIKHAQLEAQLCQIQADSKFYFNGSYAVYGVFACSIMAIQVQIMTEDWKLENEVKGNRNRIKSLEKRTTAIESKGEVVTAVEEVEEAVNEGRAARAIRWFKSFFYAKS